MYWLAIEPTNGSAGLQSVRSEQIDRRTLDMVSAGDQLSLSMSRQMTPWLFTLQWYIRVRKVTFGGLNGYSGEKWMSKKKTPPSYGEPGGPSIVDTHSYKLSPLGPALQLGGGSRVISASSFWILQKEKRKKGKEKYFTIGKVIQNGRLQQKGHTPTHQG